jgi:pyruvate,water dikinase
MRASIVELLPDPLTPLFATLGRAAINAGNKRMAAEVMGSSKAWPDESITTINDYAYYSVGFTARQLGLMAARGIFNGAVARLPELLSRAEQRWRDGTRPRYLQVVNRGKAADLSGLTCGEMLQGTRDILNAAIDHYTTLQSGLIPAAYMSESLFTVFYNRFIKRRVDPPALTFMLGFDSEPIQAEKSLYDLAQWCRQYPTLSAYLTSTPAQQLALHLRSGTAPDAAPPGIHPDEWAEWRRRMNDHLAHYGHAIYDLDFAKPLPADDPAPLLETLRFFVSGQGANPHQRQQNAAGQREQATRYLLIRLTGWRRKLFQRLVTTAQKYAPLREDGLADVGLGWPVLRQMLLEIGRRLVKAGALTEPNEIFWLTEAEVQEAGATLDAGARTTLTSFVDTIKARKARWQAEKQVTPPPVLPTRMKWMGMDLEKWSPARASEQAGPKAGGGAAGDNIIKGIGASPGRVTGTARVLRGPEEFGRMGPGEVLVAAITTPAWTPLFALASGVVTDVGGPLSHSSIVAREYGIPAVLGTGVATRRIADSQQVVVDGSAGQVTLLDGETRTG